MSVVFDGCSGRLAERAAIAFFGFLGFFFLPGAFASNSSSSSSLSAATAAASSLVAAAAAAGAPLAAAGDCTHKRHTRTLTAHMHTGGIVVKSVVIAVAEVAA
jgi:hypothetical protein